MGGPKLNHVYSQRKKNTDVYLYFSDNFVVISFCDSTNTWLANEIGEI